VKGLLRRGVYRGVGGKKMEKEKLEKEFQQAIDSFLVKVWEDKSYHTADDVQISQLASFLATNTINDVFSSIREEEKKGFNNEEIKVDDVRAYNFGVEITFSLPNSALITRQVRTINVSEMDKNTFLKYKTIYENLKQRQKELEEKARTEYEQERKKKEIERALQEYQQLKNDNEELKARIEQLSYEIKILKSVVRKKVQYSEIEPETDELTEEEKEYLREKVFPDDC
jgi:hypothetical protein